MDDERQFYPSRRLPSSAFMGRLCSCRETKAEEGNERDMKTGY